MCFILIVIDTDVCELVATCARGPERRQSALVMCNVLLTCCECVARGPEKRQRPSTFTKIKLDIYSDNLITTLCILQAALALQKMAVENKNLF